MAEAVDKILCAEKHKSVDEKFDTSTHRLNAHSSDIKVLDEFRITQDGINEIFKAQLKELQGWKKERDNKLPSRIEFVVRQLIQWVTLALLALIAAKIGL